MRNSCAIALSLCVLLLSGCSGMPGIAPTETTSNAAAGTALRGMVHGGQSPIVGAHVYLLAANTTGYAGPGIPASSSNASLSLLNGATTGHSDSISGYVLTASDSSGDTMWSSPGAVGGWATSGTSLYNTNSGNVGINIGITAPVAFFPFSGMKDSFFGDLHTQGKEAIQFFTESKVIIQRWF